MSYTLNYTGAQIDQAVGEVALNTAARHTHANKAVLDTLTTTMISTWNGKADMTVVSNTAVAVADWSADATYTDYGYAATITIAGISATSYAQVVFGPDDIDIMAPVCLTGEGTLKIYASEIPAASITIPTIVYFN